MLKLNWNKAKPRTPDDELGRQEVEVGSSCCLELDGSLGRSNSAGNLKS